MHMVNDAINSTPQMQHKEKYTLHQFASSKVHTNPKHWLPFGCPVYVLDSALQARQLHHKWKHQSRVSIYLGHLPQYAKTIALVLD